jgi:CheY-like chemotaxis protein
MDIQMPELSGLDATQQIRALPGGTAPFIVGLTADASQGARRMCIEAGMNDYMPKPVRGEQLASLLTRVA